MRIATWNVNSIRTRAARVLAWLTANDVDVLAVQETKCTPEQFPTEIFEEAGYQVVAHGINQWNGVAIISRVRITDVEKHFPGQPGFDKDPNNPQVVESRAIGATCGGVRLWSLYVPNGRSLQDPHLAYKLDWLAALREAGAAWLAEDPQAQVALMGDWNIAPRDEDVWSVDYYEGRTHTSPAERAAFDAVVDAGYADLTRPYTQGPGVYTYWDYTQLAFPKRRGMRIDFCLGSPALQARVEGAFIDREERKGKGASDHAPVVVDLSE